jgi:thioredoxin reductase (NADPH)
MHFKVKEEMYEAKSVIIATGVTMSKPYAGENELLGNGVSYCATCDAQLYKNKEIVAIIDSMDELDEVHFLAEVASNVKLIPLFDNNLNSNDKITVINEKPTEIIKNDKKRIVKTDNNEYNVDGVFILRKSVPMSYLIYGIEMDGNHIKTDRLMKTNLRGVFACGDIVGKPYQYIKAAGEGNVAALSAVSFLDELRRNN